MKKLLLAIILCAASAASVFGQSNPPLRIKEADGNPNVSGVTQIVVTNGSITQVSGKTVYLTTGGGGGGGSPGGSTTQVQYNNAGSFGGITGATTDGTAVTLTSPILVTPAIGIATGTSLTITGAFRTSTANQRIYFGSGSNSFRWSDTVGPYFIDNTATGGLVFNMQSLSSDRTFTWPNASGTVTTIAGTQTLTNKTVTDSTNVLGGVTMTLGSDATGDIYYRNSGGVLTRLGVGSNGQVLTLASGLPSWAAASGGGITIGTTTITGGTSGRMPYNNAGVYGETTGFTSNGTAVTATAGNLIATSPKFITDLSDTNGNEIFKITATASAVNEFTVANAATGAGPTLSATGSDINIPITLTPKGTGSIISSRIGSRTAPAIAIGATNAGIYTRNSGELNITSSTNDMIEFNSSLGLLLTTNAPVVGWTGSSTAGSGARTGISEASAKVIAFGDGSANANGWFTYNGTSRVASDLTSTSTTFANITGITSTLIAGRKYTGRLIIKCNNSTAGEGIKLDFNGGTATMTNFWAAANASVGGTTVLGTAISTSLSGVINFTTITGETIIVVEISFVVNAAGTFIPRFAENSAATGTLTIALGSYQTLVDTP